VCAQKSDTNQGILAPHNLGYPIAELKALALDTEYSTKQELAELAFLELTADGVLTGVEYVSLVKIPVTSRMWYGNITPAENGGAPLFADIAARVKEIGRGPIVFAWNKSADITVLQKALAEVQIELEDVMWLDPMVLVKRLGFTDLTLAAVGGAHLGMEVPPSAKLHRARADVLFMYPIIGRLVAMTVAKHDLVTIDDLVRYIETGGTPASPVTPQRVTVFDAKQARLLSRVNQNESIIRRWRVLYEKEVSLFAAE